MLDTHLEGESDFDALLRWKDEAEVLYDTLCAAYTEMLGIDDLSDDGAEMLGEMMELLKSIQTKRAFLRDKGDSNETTENTAN